MPPRYDSSSLINPVIFYGMAVLSKIPYFSIDNAHPKLFDIPFDV
jgi:hypothetical protein